MVLMIWVQAGDVASATVGDVNFSTDDSGAKPD